MFRSSLFWVLYWGALHLSSSEILACHFSPYELISIFVVLNKTWDRSRNSYQNINVSRIVHTWGIIKIEKSLSHVLGGENNINYSPLGRWKFGWGILHIVLVYDELWQVNVSQINNFLTRWFWLVFHHSKLKENTNFKLFIELNCRQ